MPESALPLPIRGLDNRSEPTALPEGAVTTARNVDISREGTIASRKGARLCVRAPGLHSVFAGREGVFGIQSGVLMRLRLDTGHADAVAPMASDEPATWCQTPRGAVVVNGQEAGLVTADGYRALAPETPAAPDATPRAMDGSELAAGQYGVALSYRIGDEEGAVSAARYVDIANGDGIVLGAVDMPASPDVTEVRVYLTEPNGGTLYHHADTVPGLPMNIGRFVAGAEAATRYLEPMAGGDHVVFWNGRLVIARGSSVMLGEPLRYGLYSPRYGFVQRAEPVEILAATDGALFVATRTDTVALIGRRPADLEMRRVSCGRPMPGSSCQISLDNFTADWAQTSATAAVWLTDQGYVVGLPDGTVISPQAAGLRLPGAGAGRWASAAVNRRLYTCHG